MPFDQLSTEVRRTLVGILVALALASLGWRLLRRFRPGDYEEVRLRTRTWWVIVGWLAVAMAVGRNACLVFFAFVSFLALKEYLSLIPTRRADRRVLFWAYLSIPFQYYWIYADWYGMAIVWVPVYLFLLLPIRMITIGQTDGFLRAVGTLHWGLMTTVFCLSHAAMLVAIRPGAVPRFEYEPPTDGLSYGPGLLLFLILITQANDVAQFLWGKSIGKRRVVPRVSPGKTVAGFLGGVLTTIALSALLGPYLTPMDLRASLVAGALLGIGGFFGDVTISALKRDLGVKDSGSSLPGHGGILDRVDSLTYTSPLFFHYIWYCYG